MSTFQLRDFQGRYRPGGSLKIGVWILVSWFFFETPLPLLPSYLKVLLLKFFGAEVGCGCVIKPNVKIKFPWLLALGDDVWLGERVWIDNVAPISFGNNICVSQGVVFESGNHDARQRSFPLRLDPITVENDVWIGCFSIVLPGAIIERGTFVRGGEIIKPTKFHAN